MFDTKESFEKKQTIGLPNVHTHNSSEEKKIAMYYGPQLSVFANWAFQNVMTNTEPTN